MVSSKVMVNQRVRWLRLVKKIKQRKIRKIKMEALSNWKEDYVWEADEEQMEKE